MSERTFQLLSADDISALHTLYWAEALEDLTAPEALSVPETAEPKLTGALPHARATSAYTAHVEACERCQGDWLDQCPAGDRLSGLAADAMAAQSDLARQN